MLFNDAASISEFTAWNALMINKRGIEETWNRSDRS
jgi:hypothetical protein